MSTPNAAHHNLVDFANRLAGGDKELGENTFGVKYLAELGMIAGQQLMEGRH